MSVHEPTTEESLSQAGRSGRGDQVFSGLARAAGLTILVSLAAVFVFLLLQGIDGFSADQKYYEPSATNFLGYVSKLLFGTALAALIAMVIAVPFAIGVALFLSHYAPRSLATPIAYVIDLLAAVPSVVYGLWGARTLAGLSQPFQAWLNEHFSWLPFFSGEVSATGRTILVAGLVLAIMVLPITTAICREVFARTPRLHEEAALALGATRWEMIRMAVLPFGRSGVISGAMLGLGRALGETMAVAIILSGSGVITFNLISSNNPSSIAANIALQFPDSTGLAVNTLIATGLVLFIITLAINSLARYIVNRRREFSGAN